MLHTKHEGCHSVWSPNLGATTPISLILTIWWHCGHSCNTQRGDGEKPEKWNVLYGCETWPLALWEEHRLMVLENRALKKIYVHKRDEVTQRWKKYHSEELHNLYTPPTVLVIKSSRMRWAGKVARMEEMSNVYTVLLQKPEGMRQLGRKRSTWEDNIKRDVWEIRGKFQK
jgi:hypothetical protein